MPRPPVLVRPQTVCMVIPPSSFLLDERVFMSLGILKVAAVLEQAGVAVEMLDLSGIKNYVEAFEDHLRSTGARVVALTTTTPQLPAAVALARRARELRPDARLILGGPHVTLVSSAVKLEKRAGRVSRAHAAFARMAEIFDVLVAGDGERAIFQALAADAPKLVDADDPKNGMFLSDGDFERSPFPARHLVDASSYHYTIDGRNSTSLIGQLGCPFGCGFCGGRNSRTLRAIRVRGVESIISEVEHLHRDYGYTGFMFYDDELNVSPKLLELLDELSDLQARLGVDFRLRGFVKSELFNAQQAAAMVRAGFRWILCGFEAAAPRILENINKRATLEDNTRAVETARAHGLKVKALMSVGHPGESEETIRAVRDWLVESKPDDFDCTIITTYPGTPYYDEAIAHPSQKGVWTYTAKKSGDRLHAYEVDFSEVAEYYKGDPDSGYRSYVFTDFLSAAQLVELRDWVERDVRRVLGIPFNASAAAVAYEHSMGQGANALPGFVLRRSSRGATARDRRRAPPAQPGVHAGAE
jgi:anaerobic magnesium-protoporphyrin IX monomethyl ester cyclase